jgi:hypothetical protein
MRCGRRWVLKLLGKARRSHVMDLLFDEGAYFGDREHRDRSIVNAAIGRS